MAFPKISSAFLAVTHDCCCACTYCFVRQNPAYISYGTARAAADWLYQNWLENGSQSGQLGINFFGGEPMLCYDSIIKPLVLDLKQAYPVPFEMGMTTNGVLLNEERLQFLSENHVSLLLSMDGDRKTQEMQRPMKNGASSFDILAEKIPLMLRYYPGLGFRSTATPESAGDIFDNFLFAKDAGFQSWFTMPDHFAAWEDSRIALLRREAGKFADYFIDSCRKGERPVQFRIFEKMFANIRMINSAIESGTFREEGCDPLSCHRCGLGGTYYAAIDPSGRVFACQDMSSFAGEENPFYLGSIFTGVDEERRKALVTDYNSRRCHGKDCTQCRLGRICDGACVANNYMANGDIRSVPTIHCEWYQILLDEAIRVMNVLGEEDNPLFRQIWRESRG